MSHLNKYDGKMLFDRTSYRVRLGYLLMSYVTLVVAIVLTVNFLVRHDTMSAFDFWLSIVAVLVLLAAAIATIIIMQAAALDQRSIRNAITALVDTLDYQLDRLSVGQSHVFNASTHGLIRVVRRQHGWLIQAYTPGDGINAEPAFQAVIMKYRMAKVDYPDVVLDYKPGTMALIKQMERIVASQAEFVATLRAFPFDKQSIEAGIDQLEELVNSQS